MTSPLFPPPVAGALQFCVRSLFKRKIEICIKDITRNKAAVSFNVAKDVLKPTFNNDFAIFFQFSDDDQGISEFFPIKKPMKFGTIEN